MLTFNCVELLHFLENLFFPAIRILAFLSVVPIFGEKFVNSKFKIILAFLISFLIYPFIPNTELYTFSKSIFSLILQQIVVGLIFGFVIKIAFSSLILAGEIISSQMGLSFSNVFDLSNKNNISVISNFLNLLTCFLFLTMNGHLELISIVCNSFYKIPISNNFLKLDILLILVKFSGIIFLSAIKFSFPIFLSILVLNFILAILNRISPQISIFSVGFPLTLAMGMFLIYTLIPISFLFFKNLFLQILIIN